MLESPRFSGLRRNAKSWRQSSGKAPETLKRAESPGKAPENKARTKS